MPYLNILSEFRDNVRTEARKIVAEAILSECDKLRDDTLPNVGVRLEDVEGSLMFLLKIKKKSTLKALKICQ